MYLCAFMYCSVCVCVQERHDWILNKGKMAESCASIRPNVSLLLVVQTICWCKYRVVWMSDMVPG